MLLTFNLELNQFHRHHFDSFNLNKEKTCAGQGEREREMYLRMEINRANPGLKVHLMDYYDWFT